MLGPAHKVPLGVICLTASVAKSSFSFQCLHRVSANLEGNETLKVVELDRRVNATF